MHFKAVLDVSVLLYAGFQCVVDKLELRDHVVSTLAQADLNVDAKFLGDLALAARSRNVLLSKLHPRHRVRHPAQTTALSAQTGLSYVAQTKTLFLGPRHAAKCQISR